MTAQKYEYVVCAKKFSALTKEDMRCNVFILDGDFNTIQEPILEGDSTCEDNNLLFQKYVPLIISKFSQNSNLSFAKCNKCRKNSITQSTLYGFNIPDNSSQFGISYTDGGLGLIVMDIWCVGYFIKWMNMSYVLRNGLFEFSRKYCSFRKNRQVLSVVKLLCRNNLWLDYSWNYRINGQVCKRIALDDTMNWLNTLGGGYSALGDHYTHHAVSAGRTSLKQLKIAIELGDPPTLIRCRLYMALSLMQIGKLRISKHILRSQYNNALLYAKLDHRLVNMCKGLWSRLGYLYSQRSKKNITTKYS